MGVTANLLLGADGSTRLGADSRGLSTPEDRAFFLAERRKRDCIIIGGKTAANFGYQSSPCPVIVLSRTNPSVARQNQKVHWWTDPPAQAVQKAKLEFGANIGLEAGPRLLFEFLNNGLVDRLELSVTSVTGGEDKINLTQLLGYFTEIKKERIAETFFYTAKQPIRKSK